MGTLRCLLIPSFCDSLKALYAVFLLDIGSSLQEERKINKETKIPFFFTSLTNSSLQSYFFLRLSLKKKERKFFENSSVSHGKKTPNILQQKKKKTKITILRQETTNISTSQKKNPSHKKQLTSVHQKNKNKK